MSQILQNIDVFGLPNNNNNNNNLIYIAPACRMTAEALDRALKFLTRML